MKRNVCCCTYTCDTMTAVVDGIPFQRLKRSTLFVDVLSVKEFPRQLMLGRLPPEFDILCTHPMFGPESGRESWEGLPFVFERVRVADDEMRRRRVESFLQFFEREGCRMVDMTCLEHDRHDFNPGESLHAFAHVRDRRELRHVAAARRNEARPRHPAAT